MPELTHGPHNDLLSGFFGQDHKARPIAGHLINTNAWPPEAQAILLEKPGAPISSDQWKRIRVTLNKYNAVTPMAHLFAADVRSSWYVFLISPLLALVLLRRRFSTDTIPVALAATAPSLLVLTACAFSNSPYLK